MKAGTGGGEAETQDHSGRLRLTRKEGIPSAYYWKDNDWVPLSEWHDAIAGPVYLDFRFQWKTANPSLQTARFSIERLETPEGVWLGSAGQAGSGPTQGTTDTSAGQGFIGGETPAVTGDGGTALGRTDCLTRSDAGTAAARRAARDRRVQCPRRPKRPRATGSR